MGDYDTTLVCSNGTAKWTFDELPFGEYQVAATWVEDASRESDAPFLVKDGDSTLLQVLVDQRVAPMPDVVDTGSSFSYVGSPVTITSGALVVELMAIGNVVADAVRVERVFPNAAISGPTTIEEGADYTLSLSTVQFTPASWAIDWGDGTTSNPAATDTTVDHTFADGDATYTITASATPRRSFGPPST